MSAKDRARRPKGAGRLAGWLGAVVAWTGMGLAAAEEPAPDRVDRGRELFSREWLPLDSRSHGGDGLGPVFNDSSCVACHNSGGPGGGGPASKNVDILSAFAMGQQQMQMMDFQPAAARPAGFLARALEALVGIEPPPASQPSPARTPAPPRKPDTTELVKAHAGFRSARSVVLHKFGTDPGYEAWRLRMMGMDQFIGAMQNPIGFAGGMRAQAELDRVKMLSQIRNNLGQTQSQAGEFILTHSQRNATALFGAGRIDAIPDAVLEAAAKVRHRDFPEVVGRVSRQKDGRIGRFGWKGQTPSLNDFVLTACAVELGLEVPGHPQGGRPQDPESKAQGLDLTADECAALVAYVGRLPRPIEARPTGAAEARQVVAGKDFFDRIGCATCHTPTLGDVEGIYSDLLLHDLGPELGDTGAYGVFVPDSSDPDFVDPGQPAAEGTNLVVPEDTVVVPEPVVVPAGFSVQVVETTPPVAVPTVMVAPSAPAPPPTGPATRLEWRTPPLWGLRDSGPYLHDGRADTLEQAIALHGGQAASSARRYFELTPDERMQLQAFLKTLVAPAEALADASE